MKWLVVQLVEGEEPPQLESDQAGLCCPVAEWADHIGYELLNQIETDAYEIGKQVQQFLFVQQLQALDAEVSDRRAHNGDEPCQVVFDGQDPLTFVTRMGVLRIPVQQAHCHSHEVGFTPLNSVLPEHQGPITTRSVQELSCLFAALSPSYEMGNHLLAIALQEPQLLSTSKSERLAQSHGQALRDQEAQEAAQVLQAPPEEEVPALPLRPSLAPRRSTLADEMVVQVRQQLATADLEQPPLGLSPADWQRIVTQSKETWTQSTEGTPDWFAELGPYLRPGEVLLLLDEVVIKSRPQGTRLLEYTARIATPAGFWYISGQGAEFQRQVVAALRRIAAPIERLIVIADGARWIRTFYAAALDPLAVSELILDWYHLRKKCHQLLSMVCRGRQHRETIEDRLWPLLWYGDVDTARQLLETLRPQARHADKLDELLGYLDKHRSAIPNYDQRRANCQYNGAGMVEKENDLLVARRQKHRGMQWVAAGADTICALRTLWFNGQWDTYWNTGLTTAFALAA
jgi:hypothetical protein